jgi:hypothetical protein
MRRLFSLTYVLTSVGSEDENEIPDLFDRALDALPQLDEVLDEGGESDYGRGGRYRVHACFRSEDSRQGMVVEVKIK